MKILKIFLDILVGIIILVAIIYAVQADTFKNWGGRCWLAYACVYATLYFQYLKKQLSEVNEHLKEKIK